MAAGQHGNRTEHHQGGGVGRDLQVEVGTGVNQQGDDAHGRAEADATAVFFKIVVTVFLLSRLFHKLFLFRVQCRRPNRLAVSDGARTPA